MTKPRDFKAEYRRRVERGQARGLTRSQARGHPRADEALVHPPRFRGAGQSDKSLIKGARLLQRGQTLSQAARQAGVSAERLRAHVKRNKLAVRKGRSWSPIIREMRVYTRGQARTLQLGFEASSLNGKHLNAVQRFLRTNDPKHLSAFDGLTVSDLSGREHVLETHPNALYRLAAASDGAFEQIYRLISPET